MRYVTLYEMRCKIYSFIRVCSKKCAKW